MLSPYGGLGNAPEKNKKLQVKDTSFILLLLPGRCQLGGRAVSHHIVH